MVRVGLGLRRGGGGGKGDVKEEDGGKVGGLVSLVNGRAPGGKGKSKKVMKQTNRPIDNVWLCCCHTSYTLMTRTPPPPIYLKFNHQCNTRSKAIL